MTGNERIQMVHDILQQRLFMGYGGHFPGWTLCFL